MALKALRTKGRPKTTRKRTVGKQTWVEELGSRKSRSTRQHEETRRVDKDTTLTGGVAAGAAMMLLGESNLEAQRLIGPIVALK